VVSTAPIEQPVWQAALRLHADDVFVLPADEQRLVVYLGDFLDGAVRGRTVGVIGGCGGAGASTFAAALALVSARSGEPTTIVDADPLAWGLELVLGCEAAAGLRWPDVARTEGRVSAAALRGALPHIQGLAVLSWSRDAQRRTDPDVARTMLQAAQRGSTLVVVDLPRAVDRSAARLLDACDVVVLVVVSDVHGIASAAPVRAMLRDRGANVRLVVRDAPGSDLGTSAIESRLGTTVVGRLPTRRSIRRAVEAGIGPLARGGIERQCRAVLSRLSSAQGAL
jgi:secretion/DNA translocation related CpaE-like protein